MRRRAGRAAADRRARALSGEGEPLAGAASVVPFAAVSFAYFGYAGLFGTYAPLWFQSLGYSTFAIGALTAVQSATRLFGPYAWGWVADHARRRERLLVVAVAGSLVASLGYFADARFAWIAFVTTMLFVCTAGVIPISEATLAHHVSQGGQLDIGRYGRVRVWGSLGFIAAVGSSGFALQALGVDSFPAFVSGLLATLLAASLRLPPADETHTATPAGGSALAILAEPVVAWFFAGVFLTVLAHTSLYAFYSLYLASLGYGKGAIGLLWTVGVAVEVGWFFFQGRWVHRLTPHGWLLVAALASAARFALIAAFAGNVAVLVFAQCLHALSFANQHSACIAVVSRHFPARMRGRGQALYTVLGYGASGVVGGLAGGALSQRFGFAAVFWAASVAALAAALCCRHAMRLGLDR